MTDRAFDQYSWLTAQARHLEAKLYSHTDASEAREYFVDLALKLEQQLLMVLIDEACQVARGEMPNRAHLLSLLRKNPSLNAVWPSLQRQAEECAYQMVSRYETSSTVVRRLTVWREGPG